MRVRVREHCLFLQDVERTRVMTVTLHQQYWLRDVPRQHERRQSPEVGSQAPLTQHPPNLKKSWEPRSLLSADQPIAPIQKPPSRPSMCCSVRGPTCDASPLRARS